MGRIIEKAPDNLSDEDWERVLSACKDASYRAILKMREAKNVPQAASILFDGIKVNCGHEYVNAYLRNAKAPFRLTRIGPWGGDRRRRMLAVVPWDT